MISVEDMSSSRINPQLGGSRLSEMIITNENLVRAYIYKPPQLSFIKVMKMNPLEASQIISDEYAARILVATLGRPKSAIALSHDLGIPIAACYRRIKMLEEAKLVRCVERVLTQKGKRMSVYASNLKNAYISFEDGNLKVRFEMKSGSIEEFGGKLDLTSEVAL